MKIFFQSARWVLICLLLMLTSVSSAEELCLWSYENQPEPVKTGPRIGLALSGGGARGFAHIGVLRVLVRENIPINIIAGTSMGGIIGGLFACGYSPDELEQVVKSADMEEFFSNEPLRKTIYLGEKEATDWPFIDLPVSNFRIRLPSNISSGQKIWEFLNRLTLGYNYRAGGDFDRLSIPFRVITTDYIKGGDPVVLEKGNLGLALVACSSIPPILSPVEIEGRLLVDGGLVDNIPVNTLKEEDVDIVIGVSIPPSKHTRKELNSLTKQINQTTAIMMERNTSFQNQLADITIQPDMLGLSSSNFRQIDECIIRGERAALESIEEIHRLIERWRQPAEKDSSFTLSRMNFYNEQLANNYNLAGYFSDVTGKRTNRAELLDILYTIWQKGVFSELSADLKTGSNGLDLFIHIAENKPVHSIKFEGNDLLINAELEACISAQAGSPFNREQFEHDLEQIIEKAEKKDLILADVSSSSFDPDTGILKISLHEGIIGKIKAIGNRRTRSRVILREFPLKSGDHFIGEKAYRGINNIYGTGLFHTAIMEVVPSDGTGDVDIIIRVREKNHYRLRLGLRFDETRHTEGRAQIVNDNFLGGGNKLSFLSHLSQKRTLLLLENRSNRIFSSYLTFRLGIYAFKSIRPEKFPDHRLEHEYEDRRYGMIFSFGRHLKRLGRAAAQLRAERVTTENLPLDVSPTKLYQIRSLILRSEIETLDSYPFPNNGNKIILFMESASRVLGGTERYVKSFAGVERYKTFLKKHTFHWKLLIGSEDSTTPSEESFRLGGFQTLVGSRNHDTANTHFYGEFMGMYEEEKRGHNLLHLLFEYRLKIPRYFYLSLYAAGANLKGFTFNDMEFSCGIRGSFDLFGGPFSVGWGRAEGQLYRVYLTMGREY